MPRRYNGPERDQLVVYIPPIVKTYIRHMGAQNKMGSATEYVSRVLTAEYERALAAKEPVALFVAQLGEDYAGQDLEGS